MCVIIYWLAEHEYTNKIALEATITLVYAFCIDLSVASNKFQRQKIKLQFHLLDRSPLIVVLHASLPCHHHYHANNRLGEKDAAITSSSSGNINAATNTAITTSIPFNKTTCGETSYARGPHQKVLAFTFYLQNKTSKSDSVRQYFAGITKNLDLMPKVLTLQQDKVRQA